MMTGVIKCEKFLEISLMVMETSQLALRETDVLKVLIF